MRVNIFIEIYLKIFLFTLILEFIHGIVYHLGCTGTSIARTSIPFNNSNFCFCEIIIS